MNWFELLTLKVNTLGRRIVESDTGMSKTTLSQVLNKKYAGSMANIEANVLAAYANIKVTCPVLGSIPVKRCNIEKKKPFSAANPTRVRLYKTCKTCPHNKQGGHNEPS
ncbi:hypothetical protein [uncultured Paraglaciecola sp.]|uniref:hypothetical protein n=1 Tax=uncultured Paraglaciecola sp. TaxID=1765024 RepID=UPI002606B88D|nr:hypothetical protein [uncultured Paraglaciecola sp.]